MGVWVGRVEAVWVRTKRWLLGVVTLGVAVTAAARAAIYGISSDNLYLAALYRDLVVDHAPVAGWLLQPAPSFFPDLPIFFVLRFVCAKSNVALGMYSLLVFAAYGALVAMIGRLVRLRRDEPLLAALLAIAVYAGLSLNERFLWNSLWPAHHGAALTLALASMVLIGQQLRANRLSWPRLLALVVLNAATAANDRIAIAQSVVPLVAATVLTACLCRTKLVVTLSNAFGLGIAGSLGDLLSQWPDTFGFKSPRVDVAFAPSFGSVFEAIGYVQRYPWHPTTSGFILGTWLLLMLAGGGFYAVALYGTFARRRTLMPTEAFVSASMVGVVVCSFLIASFTHMTREPYQIRYMQPIAVLPVLALALLFVRVRRLAPRAALVLAVVGVSYLCRPEPLPTPDGNPTPSAYPEDVRCLDDIASKRNVQWGYADYWQARKTVELSRQSLRLLPLRNAEAHGWIVNPFWFRNLPPTIEGFVVSMHWLDANAIRARFGEPNEVLSCPQGEVWVYRGKPLSAPVL